MNVRDINAFALPGGPMFVNRGMIEAAKTEGEVAGVMAHEISHVALRHGTAQASKATPYQIGQIAGGILGAIVGGTVGQVISQGTAFGLGTAFMKYGREYERQADIEGAQIMARAGYDPRDMASMFRTIEQQSGGSGPEWLSDHPNPGNRSAYITKEAELIRVSNPVRDTAEFDRVKSRLRSMPKAPTTEEATRNGRRTNTSRGEGNPGNPPSGRVSAPSSRYTEYEEGGLFRVSVPSNWRELSSNSSVTFAPDGAYGSYDGQSVFTHGVEIGVARNSSRNLQRATDELIDSLAESNPRLRRESGYRQRSVGGRNGLQTVLTNVSDVTRQEETIQLVTTLLSDGSLMYAVGVAPDNEVLHLSTPLPARHPIASSLAPIAFPRGFAPRTPLHALSCAASPAHSVRVARSRARSRSSPSLRVPALRHLEPVQFLFDLVECIVADFVVGAHGVHGLTRRMERFAMQASVRGVGGFA